MILPQKHILIAAPQGYTTKILDGTIDIYVSDERRVEQHLAHSIEDACAQVQERTNRGGLSLILVDTELEDENGISLMDYGTDRIKSYFSKLSSPVLGMSENPLMKEIWKGMNARGFLQIKKDAPEIGVAGKNIFDYVTGETEKGRYLTIF